MLRNLILLAVLGLVVAKDVSRCAWGESYWCSSLRVAKNCGAVDHCISTVWTTTKLKQDSNDTCVFCENIIKDVKNFLADQQTEDEIKQFLDSACSVIPDATLAKECQQTVDEDLPEIFQLIQLELDPEMICAAIGLCSGLEDLVKHREPSKPKVPIHQVQSAVTIDICGDCKAVMAELKAALGTSATAQEVEDFLDNNFCSNLGTLADACKVLVASYTPEIMQMLANDVDPATMCGELGLCNKTAAMVKGIQPIHPKAKALKETGPKTKVSASLECVVCEFVMKELDDMLEDNSTEAEIIAGLDKVCSVLPSTISQECVNFVGQYGQAVIALLINELKPSQICSFLGLCSSAVVDLVQVDECSSCITVMNYVYSLLKEKPTQEEVEKALDKVCNFLPASLRTECTSLVNTYGPTVIQLILTETTPREICDAIRMCTNEAKIVPNKRELRGAKECTSGPSYWCASRENARKCQAEAHCEKHGWNRK